MPARSYAAARIECHAASKLSPSPQPCPGPPSWVVMATVVWPSWMVTYRAAVQRWPKDKITLRNRARIIERNWRD